MSPTPSVISIDARSPRCADCRNADECIGIDSSAPAGRRRPEGAPGPRVVRRGTHLYRTGDRFDTVYVVRSGMMKSYTISPSGENQVVAFHNPGDVVGIDGIETATHPTNAVALDTASVCALSFDRLCETSARSPLVQRRLLGKMSRRVREDEARLGMLGHKSADQRVAAFLLAQSRHNIGFGYARDELNLAMPRADIASYLALAVETVSRVLTRLQDAGVLAVNRNRITIRDHPALAEIADEPSEALALAG